MKIGVDCRTILDPEHGEAAGVGHYTYNLVDNLLTIDQKNHYILFFDRGVGDAGYFKKVNSEIRFFPFAQYKKFLPITYSHFLVASYVAREKLDVFHSPASTIPLAYGKNAVITIHDLAIYHEPAWFPRQIFSTRVSVPRSLSHAKKVIAVSCHTQKDLIKFLKIPKEKIAVILNGVEERKDIDKIDPKDRQKTKNKFGIKQDFILFIGTIQPRKNIEGLISAYGKLRGTKIYDNYELVIAGKKGWDYEKVFKEVKKNNLTRKVIFTDYISREDKIRLLNAASCFCFPSFYEGFGLSILEAFQQGTPVVTSNITSMPEVAWDAAVLVNPYSASELSEALQKILINKSLREKLIKKGYDRVKKFSWEKCARKTLAVYKSVAKK
jgi:glycosyltransferase involved in cell wall biosynthesis